jgi:hypothetical protein
MKKIAIIAIVAVLAVITMNVFGVTTITYNVPDIFGIPLFKALKAQSYTNMNISFQGMHQEGVEDYVANITIILPAYDANLPNDVFVKRRMARIASGLKVAHELKLADEARKLYLDAAPIIDVNDVDPNDMGL